MNEFNFKGSAGKRPQINLNEVTAVGNVEQANGQWGFVVNDARETTMLLFDNEVAANVEHHIYSTAKFLKDKGF